MERMRERLGKERDWVSRVRVYNGRQRIVVVSKRKL